MSSVFSGGALIIIGDTVQKSNQIDLYQIIGWFCWRGKNWNTRIKTSRSRIENQQTQPTCDANSQNQTSGPNWWEVLLSPVAIPAPFDCGYLIELVLCPPTVPLLSVKLLNLVELYFNPFMLCKSKKVLYKGYHHRCHADACQSSDDKKVAVLVCH